MLTQNHGSNYIIPAKASLPVVSEGSWGKSTLLRDLEGSVSSDLFSYSLFSVPKTGWAYPCLRTFALTAPSNALLDSFQSPGLSLMVPSWQPFLKQVSLASVVLALWWPISPSTVVALFLKLFVSTLHCEPCEIVPCLDIITEVLNNHL